MTLQLLGGGARGGAGRPAQAPPSAPRAQLRPGSPRRRAAAAASARASLRSLPQTDRPEVPSGSSGLFSEASEFHARYEFGSLLGRGAFGSVSRLRCRLTGELFAVKVVPKQREGVAPARILHRIQEEVEVLARVQGRAEAVRLFGVYEDADKVFIVTELCEGGTLEAYLKARGRLTEPEAARAAHDVLQVLAECHRCRICYGDVKPANFLLKAPGYPTSEAAELAEPIPVRVVDFGCSTAVREGVRLAKQTGTPLYMAPELFLQSSGLESDLWGVGVLLYQMLAGYLPFFDRSAAGQPPGRVARAILQAEVSFEGPAWAGIDPLALDLVTRLLDRDPASRLTAEQALGHPWIAEKCGLEEGCAVAETRTLLASELPPSPVLSIILP